MKLTAKTFSPKKPWSDHPACMSVYQNAIRFNKRAADVLGLPATLAFDFDQLTVSKDPEGFEVKISGSWMEFVIHNRSLTRYVLKRLGKSKAIFQIVPSEAQEFALKPQADDFLYDQREEMETIMNPMP